MKKTMKIKKSNPERRKSFRARLNCDNAGQDTKQDTGHVEMVKINKGYKIN